MNLSGGKWIIRLRKGVADHLWEDLVLAVIGDQFADCDVEPSGEGRDGENGVASEWPQICGCTISVRQNEDIITVWNRLEGDMKMKEKIKYVPKMSAFFPAKLVRFQPNDTKSTKLTSDHQHRVQIQ